MTWIKLDNRAVDHPKVASLTDRAFRWWVRGLSYASAFLTDGLLPPVFWKKVPKPSRSELTNQRLWDWADPNFLIHDYHHHQSRKEDVEYEKERNRVKAAAYRDRKRQEKNVTGNVTGDASPKSDRTVPNPDSRDQRTDTENREQRTTTYGPAVIPSSREIERLKEANAFVGSVLKVPKVLHFELMGKSGADADRKLQSWYLELNDKLEESGKGTGDIFEWLRPRHQAYALQQGWIEPAPKPQAPEKKPFSVAEALAREAAKKAERVQ